MTITVAARDTPEYQKGIRVEIFRGSSDPTSPRLCLSLVTPTTISLRDALRAGASVVTLVPSAHPMARPKGLPENERATGSGKLPHVGRQDTAFTIAVQRPGDALAAARPTFVSARVAADGAVTLSLDGSADAVRLTVRALRLSTSKRDVACHLCLVGHDGFLAAPEGAGLRLVPTASEELAFSNAALWHLRSPADAPTIELTPLIAPLFKQPSQCASAAIPAATLSAWAASSGYGISGLREDAVLWASEPEMRLGAGGFGQVYVAAVAAKTAAGAGGGKPIAAAAVKAFQQTGSDDIEMTEISEF